MTNVTETAKAQARALIESGEKGGMWNKIVGMAKKGAIQQTMEFACNNQSEAARLLGINRATLRTTAHDTMTPDELREIGML
jgi:DNA-binding protein Fis